MENRTDNQPQAENKDQDQNATEDDNLVSEGHDYDGIKEYDNYLPGWWTYMFYLTIAFSAIYMAYYTGKTRALSEYGGIHKETAWSRAIYRSDELDSGSAKVGSGDLLLEDFIGNPSAVKKGSILYTRDCATCHGQNGEGIAAPNLTDKYWLHGGSAEAINKSIAEGYPSKGMLAWEPTLGKKGVYNLTAYLMTLKGKDLKSARGHEGVAE